MATNTTNDTENTSGKGVASSDMLAIRRAMTVLEVAYYKSHKFSTAEMNNAIGSLNSSIESAERSIETDDFFCIAATTSGRVRIGFEVGQFKRCEIPEAEGVMEILGAAIRHAKGQANIPIVASAINKES